MTVKIRMRVQGRRNRPFYRIVVANSRSPRDGRFIECVGWYNPVETDEEKQLEVDASRIRHWLDQGAQLTEKAGFLIARAAPEVAQAHREKLQARASRRTAKRRKGKQ